MPIFEVKCSMASGTAGFPKTFCVEAEDIEAAKTKAKEEYIHYLDSFFQISPVELEVLSGTSKTN